MRGIWSVWLQGWDTGEWQPAKSPHFLTEHFSLMQWIRGLQLKENISSNQGNNHRNIGIKWSIAALPLPAPPPPHFYTCARLNQTHSCWAESLQFQMCVCLIELLRAISVVTGTLLPLCSSHHVNKTIPAFAKFTSKFGLFCHVLLRRPHK